MVLPDWPPGLDLRSAVLRPLPDLTTPNCIIRARSSRTASARRSFPQPVSDVRHLNCRGDTVRRGEARNDSLTGAFTHGSDDHLRVIGNQVGPPLIRHSGEVLSW